MDKILLFEFLSSNNEKIPVYFDIQDWRNNKFDEFSVQRLQEYSATYHPEKITYTGVTVGGVHTGGFTKEDAHFTTQGKNTSYAKLMYKKWYEKSATTTIHQINFPKHMQEIALREVGIPFSNPNNTGYLLYTATVKASQSDVIYALSSGDALAQSHIVNSQLQNNSSYEVCSKIGVFLTRAIHGDFLTSEQRCEIADTLLTDTNPLACVMAADFLWNASTPEEQKRVKTSAEKMNTTELYKLGNRYYCDKEIYEKALPTTTDKVLKICFILSIIATAAFFIMACIPGSTTIVWVLAMFFMLPAYFLIAGIIAAFSPSPEIPENSYYTCKNINEQNRKRK